MNITKNIAQQAIQLDLVDQHFGGKEGLRSENRPEGSLFSLHQIKRVKTYQYNQNQKKSLKTKI